MSGLKATAAGIGAGLAIGVTLPAKEPATDQEQRQPPSFADFAPMFADVKDDESVQIGNIDRSMVPALGPVAATFTLAGEGKPMITEGTRKYIPKTRELDPNLHPLTFAFDVRAKHIPPKKREMMRDRIKRKLPPGFRVKLHGTGDNIHFHIERFDDHTKPLLDAHRKKIGWKPKKN
jgi:hypothetical protein